MLIGYTNSVWAVVFLPDRRCLVSASYNNTVRIWNSETGEHLQTLTGHPDSVRAVAFSPDGRRLALASEDKAVQIWDPETCELQQMLEIGRTITKLAFDCFPPGRLITDLGSIALDLSTRAPSWSLHCIKADGSWITWNRSDVIFFPTEYCPTTSIVRGQTLVIGCSLGRILLFKFSIANEADAWPLYTCPGC